MLVWLIYKNLSKNPAPKVEAASRRFSEKLPKSGKMPLPLLMTKLFEFAQPAHAGVANPQKPIEEPSAQSGSGVPPLFRKAPEKRQDAASTLNDKAI